MLTLCIFVALEVFKGVQSILTLQITISYTIIVIAIKIVWLDYGDCKLEKLKIIKCLFYLRFVLA
jgi:hypothetical protein